MNENFQTNGRINLAYLLLLTLVASIGGLLFGYDTAVIAGGIGFLRERFGLTPAMTGWAASSALVGCVFGALFAGVLGDRYGRKKMLILCAILFAVSALGSALPRTLTEFSLARFLGGLGVGAASMLSPLYIAEIAPARIRGRLVSLYQMAIVLGIFGAYFVNLLIQRMGDQLWNVEYGWRWMFGSETVPALLFLLLLFLVPESPRWLAGKNQNDRARAILSRIVGPKEAHREMAAIEEALTHESGSVRQLLDSGFRTAVLIGMALSVFSQVTGIGAIMYYAPEIFKATGASVDSSFLQAISVGGINILFTLVAIWLIDRAGRKVLLMAGTAVMSVALTAVGYFYYIESTGLGVLVCVLVYVAAYASSLGPVTWVMLSEIFPTRIRGQAMSIATVTLWVACFFVSQTFPMLIDRLGSPATFGIYAIMSAACFVFVATVIPETKGKTLEEIESNWMGGIWHQPK